MRPLISLASACALALVCIASAGAGPRMYLGFLDDLSFRYSSDRVAAFDEARQADATVVRTIVRWYDVAPTRPARPSDPFDPAYRFDDLDEFVRSAQQRGIEVLLTVWGTPPWANGGRAPAVAPADARDLGAFAHALARRYSGAYPGYPFARFYSIWNEPNNERFLAADDPPATYAALASAAYDGIKSGSPRALVAAGETAARHAPAAFMEAVARANPDLRFDAWAHHPYPPSMAGAPDDAAAWPDVGLLELGRFGNDVDRAFGRDRVPVWITEYAESTGTVPVAQQAGDLSRALELAGRLQRVQMFVWMMLRDHDAEPWQSGLAGKPALDAFRSTAGMLDPRNARVQIDTRTRRHPLELPALELKWHIPTAERVGMRYTLSACGRVLQFAMPAARIQADGWVPLVVSFRAQPGVHYLLDVQIEDVHGFRVRRTLELVGDGLAVGTRACARSS